MENSKYDTMAILKYGFIFANDSYCNETNFLTISLILKDKKGIYTYNLELFSSDIGTLLYNYYSVYGTWHKNNNSVSKSTLGLRFRKMVNKDTLTKSIRQFCKDKGYINE